MRGSPSAGYGLAPRLPLADAHADQRGGTDNLRQTILRRATLAAALLCGALLPAAPAAAQTEPAPQFLIERIVVEGLEREAARQIVVVESLLAAGRSYSEQQLREAVHRVDRLPFVVEADMALRRGSERGAYELVITIEAAKPLFYGVDLVGGYVRGQGEFRLGRATGTGVTTGVRKFVGSRGVLFGSAQAANWSSLDGRALLQLGYTRYGLFGRSGFATVAVSSSVAEQSDYDELQGSVQVGVPLRGNHALRGGFSYTTIEDSVGFFPQGPFETREDSWQAQLAWIYDSTDDPFAPTEGTRLTVAGEYTDRRRERSDPAVPVDPGFLVDFDVDELLLRVEGRTHRPLTARQTLGVAGYAWYTSASGRQLSSDDIEHLLELEVFHSTGVFDANGPETKDLRFEVGAGLQRLHQSRDRFGRPDDHLSAVLRTSLLFRHEWGLVRISAMYVDDVGGDS